MTIHSAISEAVAEVSEESPDRFNGFEPWDVTERPDWLLEEAAQLGIKLERGPLPFQTGYLMSDSIITVNQGGTQIGKSIPACIEAIIQASGKIPLSMRLPKGQVSNVLRNMDDKDLRAENIRRWGRRDANTGELLDHNENAIPDGTWNCGYITGVGHYPASKMPHHPAKIWICTFKQAKSEYWWPNFQHWTPDYLLDMNKGVNGFGEAAGKVYFATGSDITFITYEQGYKRAEAKAVWHIILDEEPPTRDFYVACLTHIQEHGGHLTMHFTPYNGISWSYDDIFMQIDSNPNMALFHATQYDCPYKPNDSVRTKGELMKTWEREARVFGHYSEQRGMPYYDRDKLNLWLKKQSDHGNIMHLQPVEAWGEVSELMSIKIAATPAPKSLDPAVIMYEDVQANEAYWIGVDTAEGTDNPTAAYGDKNAAVVRRRPKDNEAMAPIVAVMHTNSKTMAFARDTLYLARYYNNALLCPEARGESSGTYMSEVSAYPFVMKMTVINDMTRKPTQRQGFITHPRIRTEAFDLIGDIIDSSESNPGFRNRECLRQMAACVKGKHGRPDHAKREHDDLLFALCVSEWAFKNANQQIVFRGHHDAEPKRNPRHRRVESETRPLLGSHRGLDSRKTEKVKRVSLR